MLGVYWGFSIWGDTDRTVQQNGDFRGFGFVGGRRGHSAEKWFNEFGGLLKMEKKIILVQIVKGNIVFTTLNVS